ncbi:MAG TPA: hypothetical protein VFN61_11510 [Acidimicrobiales bacterium]|nr:hypothetical protein [Acidimicrobiales bacterium]
MRAEVLPGGPLAAGDGLPGDGHWLACARLCDEPDWLAQLIRASGRQLGTDDDMVAASLFVQNYAYRVMMVAVACATAGGVVPGSRAADMGFTMARGRPHVVGYLEPRALLVPLQAEAVRRVPEWLFAEAVANHLASLVDSVLSRFRVGRRLLWGNIASSTATAFRTMDGCLGAWVRPIGEAFFRDAPEVLRGHGAFLALEHGERSGWFWERTSCCLYDRLPGKLRCGDCSRTPAPERRSAYRASLGG